MVSWFRCIVLCVCIVFGFVFFCAACMHFVWRVVRGLWLFLGVASFWVLVICGTDGV